VKKSTLAALLALASALPSRGLTVSADFSRDIVNGTNPGTNPGTDPGTDPAPVLYAGTGPVLGSGTVWNDLQVPLSASGDLGTDTITHPIQFNDLADSTGASTTIDIQLTSGFQRSFNSTATANTSVTSLQNDRVFSSGGAIATMKVQGLDPAKRYDLFMIGSSTFSTTFSINSISKITLGTTYDGAWTEGGEYASFIDIAPTAGGEITITLQDSAGIGFGIISGLQIETTRAQFLFASSVTTTGGQFNTSYPPSNLMNSGYTSPSTTIDTTVNYAAADNNYASASGTTANFDLTFEFSSATDVDGFHVWNYISRNGGTNTSFNNGVNAYTLTFYPNPGATGTPIGSVSSGNLLKAQMNAFNSAQSVFFPSTYSGVRSVKMRVVSNFGVNNFTGMNELAFNGTSAAPAAAITSFSVSAPFVQRPATPTLSWTVTGTVTSLTISPTAGDVLPLTTGGSGSVPVSPIGDHIYTLTLNGSITQQVSVIGLPVKEKLHLYLLIGQSNMQGEGQSYSAPLDDPAPRVIKFGSRDGLEQAFITGGHRLTSFSSVSGSKIGMGVEFGKNLLVAETDPEVVICLINHALGSTAIEWWQPGATNTVNGTNLYDNAVTRINDASSFGVLKGVLWHQGEYNSNNNTNPPSDPNGYAARLSTLVDSLRTSFNNPSLPFICGKFVPRDWNNGGSTDDFAGLPNRAIVEAALDDLPNQRSNTFSVTNNGLRGNASDAIHFDAASQRTLGQRYAAAMINFYADPFLLYLGGYLTPAGLANPTLNQPNGDNDHDGYNNYLESAFLTDPSKPESTPPVSGGSVTIPGQGKFPAISFRKRFDTEAPQYVVDVSSDLANWTSNLDGPMVTEAISSPVSNGDGTSNVTVRALTEITPATPKRFLRVRVTGP